MRSFYRNLRIFSAITLFFFCWTFLPLWQAVAYATEKTNTASVVRSEGKKTSTAQSQTTGDRFEKALEDIRQKVGKADVESIKSKRIDIDSIDADLRKEFSATEKKLKDAKLPQEIRDRHAAFVKNYESNFKELKANLDGIAGATNETEQATALQKAKDHLEKVKAPSRHQKLDPNNLPFRARKAGTAKEPRTKKEDFEKDFPRQSKSKQKIALDRWIPDALSSRPQPKPVMLAFNDTMTDMPFTVSNTGATENRSQGAIQELAFADSEPFMIALATDLPAADDLAETPEIQFTDAIKAKAAELGYNPVKIYEYVRNNIEYSPTYGSIQGADMCLQSKICNDMDTASLLIALLRTSGIYAHYVYGTIEIPIDKAMNWVGGVTDPKMAGTIFATNGIPGKSLTSGGSIQFIQIEHVWVKAYIDMIPSRGAVHKQGDTWVPLDASYKQYNYTQGIDIVSAVPYDAQSFQLMTALNPDGSITNTNSALVQQNIQDYLALVQNYIQQNYPNVAEGDVLGQKDIIQQNYPILLGTLPYKTVQIGSEFATAPDSMRETMSFSIPDPTGATTGLIYNTGMAAIAGKKITLSFSPATTSDQSIIKSLMPIPHTDGTPIQTSELPPSFPAYLIKLVPELRIDGQVVATGASATMGSSQSFTMSLNEPAVGISNINNIINAGDYIGIGLDTGMLGVNQLNAVKSKLQTTKTDLETQNFSAVTKDDLLGNLLYATIATYFATLDAYNDSLTKASNVIRYNAPSVGTFSVVLNLQDVFGVAVSANPGGIMMDVDRIMQSVFSKDGSMDTVKQYMLTSGGISSALEHLIPEQLYSTPNSPVQGISAVKALQIAYDQGVPIYVINQANINDVLPQLQVSEAVKSDISNAINAGKEVTVSKTNITYNGWNGCGYILIDPETGAGSYLISGGFNGFFERLLMDAILAILYMCVFAGIVEFAYLATLEFGAAIFALEGIIAALVLRCFYGALGGTDDGINLIKQIGDLPKRIGNFGSMMWQIIKISVLAYRVCFK